MGISLPSSSVGNINDLSKKLLELIDRPTFIKDENGIYIACNSAFEKYLGITRSKILGENAFGIAPVSLAKIYVEADAELFARRTMQIYKAPVSGAKWIDSAVFTKTIFFNDNDQVAGFIGVIDISRPYRDEEAVAKQDGVKSSRLTAKEFEVLHLMTKGFSTKEIAKTLGISNHTIGDYCKTIYVKLRANNKVSVIIAAQKLGLV